MSGITVKTEFKSCPFCSSEAIKVEQMEQDNETKVWVCFCGNCGSMGPADLNWSAAIVRWNFRPSQESLLEALKIVQSLAKSSFHRTPRTLIQMCSFFDDIVLPSIEPVITQAEGEQP